MNQTNQNNQPPKPKTVNRDMIIINTANYVGRNKYVYNLPNPVSLKGARLSIHQVSIYNSTFNVSSKLNNNTMTIRWSNGVVYTITIPDGYYSIDDLNGALQLEMTKQNLYYIINSTGKYKFPINMVANIVQYKVQIDIDVIPSVSMASSLNAGGFSVPPNATWTFPTVKTEPILGLPTAEIRSLLGFSKSFLSQSTYPSGTAITYLSDSLPTLSPVFCYIFTTNLLSSRYNSVPTVLYQLALTSSFGSLIDIKNIQEQKLSIREGIYSYIEIQLWDQNYNPLQMNDPELVITLIIETDD